MMSTMIKYLHMAWNRSMGGQMNIGSSVRVCTLDWTDLVLQH
jgi:hypothetical protein